jgi:hypothetical protein
MKVSLFIFFNLIFLVSDLKANTNYEKYEPDSQQIIWFWEVMETLDRT